MTSVSILGSTGSVGTNTLEVITSLSERFRLYGISCNQNILLLHNQITQYKPAIAVITDENNQEQESLGIAFLQGLFGSDKIYKQTSYNYQRLEHSGYPVFNDVEQSKFDGNCSNITGEYSGKYQKKCEKWKW